MDKSILLYLFLLGSLAITLGQDTSESNSEQDENPSTEVGPPPPPGGSSSPDHSSGKPPNSGPHGGPPFPPRFPSRNKRSPESDEDYFRKVVRCNFLSQGLLMCTSCNTVRRCYPFNIGTVTTCSGALPYCRYGRCSATQGALCSSTSSTTTESTSSTSSTSSSSSSSSTSSSSSSTSTSTQNTNG